jgi:hypothetical protein
MAENDYGQSISAPVTSVLETAYKNTIGLATNNEDTTLAQSEYDFTYKAFPNDLGMDYLGHYVVFNINVPVNPITSQKRGSAVTQRQSKLLPNEFSKVDVLRFGNINSGGAPTGAGAAIPRRTRRIAQSIALYMPGTQLTYETRNEYQDINMSAIAGQLISGVTSTGAGILAMLASKSAAAGYEAASAVGNIIDGAGEVVKTTAQLAGAPINPCVEVMFATTDLRNFMFEFLMVPRNEKEAETVREIIKTFRFHGAPEVMRGGFTFVPPAEFDITFYHRGVENTKIPRINTCVLTGIDVDYQSPMNGMWASYRDGNPLATYMRLFFREVEIVHRLRVLQGF